MKKQAYMKLNFEEYRDRVYACWIGKNIGGTMGGPYEGKREVLDVKGFATKPGTPLPNDDLDLQLVWLHAVESLGALAINAENLGELWLNLIPPNWNEYGIGKNNIRRGLPPPMSGDYQNSWKNSNGAWIRTEIWACLAPGCPELAAKYAIEDGKVDHGSSGEGTHAAAFVAAMQSAAFVTGDLRACIEIGLSVIPYESRMADSIRFVLECYEKGMSPTDTRNAVFSRNADIGNGWFEAPSNVSYAVIGLLWGDGDFKRSMILAINCGDDTDCTAATVGATMGILGGTKFIPEDWKCYIGDDIITISINKGDHKTGGRVPKTCTELSERVIAQTPYVLLANKSYVELTDGESNIPDDAQSYMKKQCEDFREKKPLIPYSTHFENAVFIADLSLDGEPTISANGKRKVTVKVRSRREMGDALYNLTMRWWLPEGFSVTDGVKTAIICNRSAHGDCETEFSYTIEASECVQAENRCVLEITAKGRSTALYMPVLLLS